MLSYQEQKWQKSFGEKLNSGEIKIEIPDDVKKSMEENILKSVRPYAVIMHDFRQTSARSTKIFFGNKNNQ